MAASLLIVDDNEELLENLSEIMSAAGCEVRTASHPSDALRLADHYAFDAALLDYKLPEMNGLELQASLARLRPTASFFLMTGYADRILERAVIERRFTALFEKPLPVDEVLEYLR
jgi:DNA-binding NtrC family response regulator